MSILLAINRLKTKEIVNNEYVVIDKIKNFHFIVKDLKSGKISTNRDFRKQNSKIEIDGIKINDTLKIENKKGLFGIVFF